MVVLALVLGPLAQAADGRPVGLIAAVIALAVVGGLAFLLRGRGGS